MKSSDSNRIIDKFFMHSIDLLCIADKEGNFIKLNPEWEKTLGYKISEIEGKSYFDFIHPEDIKKTKEVDNKLANDQEVIDFINRYRHKDGSYRWLEWRFFPAKNEIYASARDVTETKQTEEFYDKFKASIEYTMDGVYWINEDGRFGYVNEQAYTMLGYTHDGLMALTLPEIDPSITEEAHRKNYEKLVKNNKTEWIQFETMHKKKDGSFIPVEIVSAYISIEKSGLLIYYVRNISEHKKSANELKQSDSILRSTLEAMNDGILIVSSEGKVLHLNTRFKEIFEIPEDLAKAKNDDLLLDYAKNKFSDPAKFIDEIRSIYDSSKIVHDYVEFKNGIILERQTYPLLEDCPVKGRVWIVRDVTEQKKAEEALHFTQFSIDNSLDNHMWFDDEARVVYANDAACSSLGYTHDELIGMQAYDFDPDFLPEGWEQHKKLLSEKKRLVFESRHKRKDGHIFPVEITSNYIEYKGRFFACTYDRDISEQKKSEENLRMFKTSIDHSNEAVYWMNKEGGFDYVNKKACLAHDRSKEELLGMKVYEIDPDYTKEKWDALWERCQTHKEEGRVIMEFESVHQRQDGTVFPIEVSLNHFWLGDKEYHIAHTRDISERKQNEEELKKKQIHLSNAVSMAKIGYWEYNIPKDIFTFNDYFYDVYKTSAEQVGGYQMSSKKYVELMVHPDAINVVAEETKKAIDTSDPNYIGYVEHKILFPDGEIGYVAVRFAIVKNEKGETIGTIGTNQDITDRKRIEEERKMMNIELEKRVEKRTTELHHANKDLESFAYSVSHDLRAPIRHIDGFMHLLEKAIKPKEPKVRNYINKIALSSKNMSTMIDELLQFSRLGRADLKSTQFNLSKIITEIISQYKPDCIGRNIQWNINNLPKVNGDPALLKIAFENLISNAIKYTAKKEQAIIEIGQKKKCESGTVCIYIKDNGAGFDMAYKDKLFGVFQRLHKNEEFGGIGIGLANVKQIIKKHHGTIDAESEVNNGSIFYITLPKLK